MSEVSNILKFRTNNHRSEKRDQSGEIHELPLPSPERLSVSQMLESAARNPGPKYECALVFLERVVPCPCGCGEDTEEIEVIAAGPEITPERINWIADRIKKYAVDGES